MKTIQYFAKRAAAVLAIAALATLPTKAQVSQDAYYNIDWQFNIPISNSFTEILIWVCLRRSIRRCLPM